MRSRITLTQNDVHTGELILVNAEHPIVPSFDTHLISVASDYAEVYLQEKTAAVLERVLESIGSDGQIVPVSGYRPESEQRQIYADSLRENGRAFTEKYVAKPNRSEHQTGLAIDLGRRQEKIDFIRPDFPYEGICEQFRQAAVGYGFVERYQQGKEAVTGIAHEPWHFRYVGCPHAAVMHSENLALEEYTEYLKQFPYEKQHLQVRERGNTVEIFYVSVGKYDTISVTLPECSTYQVSGNNVDGCVVTVWRNEYEL